MIHLGHGVPPQDVRTGLTTARARAAVHAARDPPRRRRPRRRHAAASDRDPRRADRHPRRARQRAAGPRRRATHRPRRVDDQRLAVPAASRSRPRSTAATSSAPSPRTSRSGSRSTGARRDRPRRAGATPSPRSDGARAYRPRRGDRRLRQRDHRTPVLPAAHAVRVGGHDVVVGRTFGDAPPGGLRALRRTRRVSVALAVNGGSAAERLNVSTGDELRLEPA